MCGIYGIISKQKYGLYHPQAERAFLMATITQLRGHHSSGMFAAGDDGRAFMLRCLGGPLPLFVSKEAKEFRTMAIKDSPFLVGHGRHATKGEISIKNTHPFNEKHITLVHNGTIHNGLPSKEDVEVDSHALTHLIAAEGIGALKKVIGAYAIVVYDGNENCVWLARNMERPLHYIEESDAIYVLSDKLDITYFRAKENLTGEVKEFKSNMVYKFCLEELTLTEHLDVTPEVTPGRYDWSQYDNKFPHYPSRRGGPFPSEPIGMPPPKYKERDKANPIIFTINSVSKLRKKHFKYEGISEEGIPVFFFTDRERPYVGETGLTDTYFLNNVDKKETLLLKHRQIVWDKDIPPTPTLDDEVVETAFGRKISKKDLEELAKDHPCLSCLEVVDVSDPSKVMLANNTKALICKTCTNDYKDQMHDVIPHQPSEMLQ
jgi:predicted glutamine amidotransferase